MAQPRKAGVDQGPWKPVCGFRKETATGTSLTCIYGQLPEIFLKIVAESLYCAKLLMSKQNNLVSECILQGKWLIRYFRCVSNTILNEQTYANASLWFKAISNFLHFCKNVFWFPTGWSATVLLWGFSELRFHTPLPAFCFIHFTQVVYNLVIIFFRAFANNDFEVKPEYFLSLY